MRLYVISYLKGGREITRAFRTRTAATNEARDVVKDDEVASCAVHEYTSAGSAEEALIRVMSAPTNPKGAWADGHKLLLVVTHQKTKVTRSA